MTSEDKNNSFENPKLFKQHMTVEEYDQLDRNQIFDLIKSYDSETQRGIQDKGIY